MSLIAVFVFHIASFLFCFFATRATCHYMNKYRAVPKTRYRLLGKIRLKHMAVLYIISIFVIGIYSTSVAVLYAL